MSAKLKTQSYHHIKELDFGSAISSANSYLGTQGAQLIPLAVLYVVVPLLQAALQRWINTLQLAWMPVVEFLLSIIMLVVYTFLGAYLILAVRHRSASAADSQLLRRWAARFGALLRTIAAEYVRMLLYLLACVAALTAGAVILSFIFRPGVMYPAGQLAITVLTFAGVLFLVFLLIVRYYFTTINTMLLDVQGFAAVNLSVEIYRKNVGIMLLYGLLFLGAPMLLAIVVLRFSDIILLSLLVSIIGALFSVYVLVVMTFAHMAAVTPEVSEA
ncbi:hypothetical protein [Spirochaeta africana]|uniref:Uncharacterized protein n=1 Tax=Spirochaeta africana (strain ATCC 700263 / DSM 8902 / Z-7692) TaxID=889378 RepID=H9UF62_SPIAZ|nr:hypothetical protein [Spirochaeta africana]AFG36155.1 hypothetical protein Spiaf_0046 [Spirochaeta africana DSM 8902]